jgi:hypothetical protein
VSGKQYNNNSSEQPLKLTGKGDGLKRKAKRLKSLITLAFQVAKDSFGFYEDLRLRRLA